MSAKIKKQGEKENTMVGEIEKRDQENQRLQEQIGAKIKVIEAKDQEIQSLQKKMKDSESWDQQERDRQAAHIKAVHSEELKGLHS